jgi:nitrogen regulatory protein P-II 1
MAIKRVEAIIRPERLEPLRVGLEAVGYPGITVTEVEGHGKQRGTVQQFRGNTYKVYFVSKVKVDIVVDSADVPKVMDTIIEVCNTGAVGDGKIFVTTVDEVVRIRTKEKDIAAL